MRRSAKDQNYSYYRHNRGCKIKEKKVERKAVNERSNNAQETKIKASSIIEMRKKKERKQ